MTVSSHRLELLSPARDAAIAREAILHGADAVYIGGPGFGARHNASNSLKDIAELVPFAHRYGAKIFVTLNTILHDDELEPAQRLITDLYQTGVDALIVQDMGILELDIPPIELHASTQCDIRTVEKAKFLSDVGFTQIVLARELNLEQIRAIHQATDATIEFFIHGALCVAYSGQCYISHAQTHLSFLANVYNQKAREFYHRYGVQLIDAAYEAHEEKGEVPVMITKHCLRFAFNLCPKQAKGNIKSWKATPMQLVNGDEVLTLKFDCRPCEMHVIGKIKNHILKMPLPGSVVASVSPDELLKTLPKRKG
ncbi:U32 family peptidase [Escherichia coli]